MQQLTGLDASFLALETANTTGFLLNLSIFPSPSLPLWLYWESMASSLEALLPPRRQRPLQFRRAPPLTRRTASSGTSNIRPKRAQ